MRDWGGGAASCRHRRSGIILIVVGFACDLAMPVALHYRHNLSEVAEIRQQEKMPFLFQDYTISNFYKNQLPDFQLLTQY